MRKTRSSPSFSRISIAAFVVSSLFVPVSATASVGPTANPCPLNRVPRDAGWTSFEPPVFEGELGIGASPIGMNTWGIDPSDPDRMFAGTTNELFRSDDGGCTWKKILISQEVTALLEDPSLVDCRKADNRTDSQYRVDPGCASFYELDIAPGDPTPRLYLQFYGAGVWARHSEILVSDDYGETWTPLGHEGAPEMALGQGHLTISPSDPKTIYVSRRPAFVVGTNDGLLFLSRDGGKTWERRAQTLPSATGAVPILDYELAVNPVDPMELWAIGSALSTELPLRMALAHSTDGGQTWAQMPAPIEPSLISIAVSMNQAGSPRLVVATPTRVFYSEDGGGTWSALYESTGEEMWPDALYFGRSGRHLFVVHHDHTVVRVDFERRRSTVIKARAYAQDLADDSGKARSVVVPGVGLVVPGDCSPNGNRTTCWGLYRYTGRGI